MIRKARSSNELLYNNNNIYPNIELYVTYKTYPVIQGQKTKTSKHKTNYTTTNGRV